MAIERKFLLDLRPLIDLGALIEEPGEGGRGDRVRRAPSGFPILQCTELGREPCSNQDGDALSLAHAVSHAPRLEAQDNWSNSFLHRGHLGLPLLEKELL